MKLSFSDQLRQAVRDCGTTRYALSRQLGISESTLSRFLSGERGLRLETLDKLADALGLEIAVGAPKTRPPSRRGPKTRKDRGMVSSEMETDWKAKARAAAKIAGERFFHCKIGTWEHAGLEGVLILYNNAPYSDDPTGRDEDTARFRVWLAEQGIRELAYATYPETGEDAGYTYAMLLQVDGDRAQDVTEALIRIIAESTARWMDARQTPQGGG